MKNLLCKMIPMIGIVLFTTGIVSCSSDNEDNEDNDLPINTVDVPIRWGGSTISDSKDLKNRLILEYLKNEVKYVGGYGDNLGVGYIPSPVDFRQENVKSADKEKVLADLTAKAHAHYKAAIDTINKFDFNSLVKEDELFAFGRVAMFLSIEGKSYDIDVVIQKPLIWDKAWSTAVADCPIKEMSFKGTKDVDATLTLADGTTLLPDKTDARRLSSNNIIIKASNGDYSFRILSATLMQLIWYSDVPEGIQIDVKDKNYLFDIKK